MTGFIFDAWSLLAFLALALMIGASLWTLIPRAHGIPSTPSRPGWIRRALHIANVQQGETVYDLGAGDGRVLVIAAREFGAQAVGLEVEPLHCAVAWLKALFSGVVTRVSIQQQDLYKADLSGADVIFLHLNPIFVEQLRPMLEEKLRPGTRIVSLDFPFEGWEPSYVDIGYLIFAYDIPPTPGSIDTYLQKTLTQPPQPVD